VISAIPVNPSTRVIPARPVFAADPMKSIEPVMRGYPVDHTSSARCVIPGVNVTQWCCGSPATPEVRVLHAYPLKCRFPSYPLFQAIPGNHVCSELHRIGARRGLSAIPAIDGINTDPAHSTLPALSMMGVNRAVRVIRTIRVLPGVHWIYMYHRCPRSHAYPANHMKCGTWRLHREPLYPASCTHR